ncbi:MAG: helix-turn-helix domain-containing protein [Terriglobales bacterium]
MMLTTTPLVAVLFPPVGEEVKVAPQSRQDAVTLQQVGAALKARRFEMELSLRQLSQESGINREYISEMEQGKRNLTLFMLLRLCHALSIECGALLESAGL